jgi:hypothetical protein
MDLEQGEREEGERMTRSGLRTGHLGAGSQGKVVCLVFT